ncbi:MAG TPA: hypothetical protein PLN52_10990 [Opitutaceae bacterium]|nr:hypothetical protein [Opitutaceae bacterium]
MKLAATPRFLESIARPRRTQVFAAMEAVATAFGQPHLHAGVGLRRNRAFMECRCGPDLRLIFRRENDSLVFLLCGTREDVTAFLSDPR